jgi:hypothetical protein
MQKQINCTGTGGVNNTLNTLPDSTNIIVDALEVPTTSHDSFTTLSKQLDDIDTLEVLTTVEERDIKESHDSFTTSSKHVEESHNSFITFSKEHDSDSPESTVQERFIKTTNMLQETDGVEKSHDVEEFTETFLTLPDIKKEVITTGNVNVQDIEEYPNNLVMDCSLSKDNGISTMKRTRDEEDTETDDDSDYDSECEETGEKSRLQKAAHLVAMCQNKLDKEEMKYKLATKQIRKMVSDAKQCLKICMMDEGLTTIDIDSHLKFECKEKSNGVKCWHIIKSSKRQKVM